MRKGVLVALALVALGVAGVLALRSDPEVTAGPSSSSTDPSSGSSAPAPRGPVETRRANDAALASVDPSRAADPFAAKEAELDPLRRRMRRHPDDIEARRAFLRATSSGISHAQWRERADVVLWFIENHPGDQALRGERLLRGADAQLWYDTDEAWREVVADPDVSTDALINAAGWYSFGDPAGSADLYRRLQEREPDNADWYVQEARGRYTAALEAHADPERRSALAEETVQAVSNALEVAEGRDRARVLAQGVGAAIDTGDWDTAQGWIRELESEADPSEDGFALRHARWSLARGLIEAGDLEGAEAELLQMGGEPPPERASSHGAGAPIARLLLREGRTEAVLEYLDLLEQSWDPAQVDAWRQQVLAGEIPDFRYRPSAP